MPDSAPKYRRIPGRGSCGCSRLWLGDDHLLATFAIAGIESYRRFYFREIAALLIRRTAVRRIWNVIFGVLGACGAGAAAALWFGFNHGSSEAFGASKFFAVVFGGAAFICLVFVLLNTLRGEGCAVYVQTAYGLAPLRAPGRVPNAERMVRQVSPLIEQAQSVEGGADVAAVPLSTTLAQ